MYYLVKLKNEVVEIIDNCENRIHQTVIINKEFKQSNISLINEINEVKSEGLFAIFKNNIYSVYQIEIIKDGFILSGYKITKHICDYVFTYYKDKKENVKNVCREIVKYDF